MTRKGMLAFAFVLAAAFVFLYRETTLFGRVWGGPDNRAASVGEMVHPEPTAEVFPVPLPVNWEATVMGVLEGGQAYALVREDGSMFYAFFDNAPEVFLSGAYRIGGTWLGTTCAYLRSVFGRCVPEVRIDFFEPAVASGSREVDINKDN